MWAVISVSGPKLSQSGDRDPQIGITKAGNVYLRSLLIECAGHILRPQGKDSSLLQWAFIWPPCVASRPGTRPSLRRPTCCSIASGPDKSRIYPSTQMLPERWPWSPVAATPCSDDCERVLVLEAEREMAASTLLSNPNRHRAFTKTAHPECV